MAIGGGRLRDPQAGKSSECAHPGGEVLSPVVAGLPGARALAKELSIQQRVRVGAGTEDPSACCWRAVCYQVRFCAGRFTPVRLVWKHATAAGCAGKTTAAGVRAWTRVCGRCDIGGRQVAASLPSSREVQLFKKSVILFVRCWARLSLPPAVQNGPIESVAHSMWSKDLSK